MAPLADLSGGTAAQGRERRGDIVADLVASELLARSPFNLVDRSDVQGVLDRQNISLATPMTVPEALWLGTLLQVDAVLVGSVLEFDYHRERGLAVGAPFVTLRLQLVRTATKELLWSATQTRAGGDTFQGKRDPLSRVGMLTVRQLVAELLAGLRAQQLLPPAAASSRRDCGRLDVPMDLDGDGVLNLADRCLTIPETRNGFDDADGCPDDAGAASARLAGAFVDGDRIRLQQALRFVGDSERLTPESLTALAEMAEFLKNNPQFVKVMIEGFPMPRVKPGQRERFSFLRAVAVKEALVRQGVAAKRLVAVGYGDLELEHQEEIEFTIVE